MRAHFVIAITVSFLAAQATQACRIPRQSEDDFKVAEVVVHGALLARDPSCTPKRESDCGRRILVDRVVKGQAERVITLRSDIIIVGCSEQSAEPGRPAFFFLSRSDDGYVVFRSEKDDR